MTTHNLAYSKRSPFSIDYGREVEEEIVRLQESINGHASLANLYPSRWLAIKLLEKDHDIQMRLKVLKGGAELLSVADRSAAHLEDVFGDESDVVIADQRYGFINGLVREVVKRTHENRLALSDQIDRVVTSRLLGIPIFLLAMWVVFKMTADVSAPFLDWVDTVINGPITNWVVAILGVLGLHGTWVESLVVEGVIGGVGGVLVFVPVLMFLYLALAILEDSGYMARAAFVMDRLMHTLGLHGKSFLPMLVGFGCTVPAFYATRTLENEKDRILTGLLVPFMSCGARLPVYVLFAAIFFPQNAGAVVFVMYLLGILTAILLGIVLKNTLFKSKEQSAFVMELPPYRLPTLRGIWFHMWERTSEFVRKAWSLILVTSIILWVLMAIPLDGGKFAETPVEASVFASTSRLISPLMAPLGFDSWEASGALITGLVAKEVVISTLAQVYAVADAEQPEAGGAFFEDVGSILTSFFSAAVDTIKSLPLIIGINLFGEKDESEPTALMHSIKSSFETSSGGHGALAGLAFMVFVLIYTPCMTAVAAERHELGIKWMWVSVVGQLALAWAAGALVFQAGRLLGFG